MRRPPNYCNCNSIRYGRTFRTTRCSKRRSTAPWPYTGRRGHHPKMSIFKNSGFAVATVRAHVSETYRLHQRVIRNRRHVVEKQRLDDEGLLTPFEFTGRSRPKVARSDEDETRAGVAAELAAWASRCADAVLDEGLDPGVYGPALGVLFSRLGGSIDDVCRRPGTAPR